MNPNSRRDFLKKSMITGGIAAVGGSSLMGMNKADLLDLPLQGEILKINEPIATCFAPLEAVTITGPNTGTVVVYDGAMNEYFRANAGKETQFKVAGALGNHAVVLEDKKGRVLDVAAFPVNCSTKIEDASGEFNELWEMLQFSLMSSSYNRGQLKRMNGKHYLHFSSWFQDHMYAVLGMRYFEKELKSGVDLYTDGQREDGMIHDNYKHEWDPRGSWSRRFDYGNFVTVPEDPTSSCIYVRVPVENMAEFTYMEGVYLTWKATGDDRWMESKLDSMLKAMNYTLTDPYRWSEKFNLTKRGYTIDIWDFQNNYDTKISGDTMRVYLDKSRFGILYADNVRFAQSCNYLSEMLSYAGRKPEAQRVKSKAEEIKKRIDDLSWNGEFYRHWVPEDPEVKRDFGDVDETRQVTLSNTWVLNRGMMEHEKIVAIIKTYLRIKDEMPASSPGEWYCCYPPFEKGWSAAKWNYMNGGVSPIAAGELSRACFEHGYEAYGVDILRRVKKLAEKRGNRLEGAYKGAVLEEPRRTFRTLNIAKVANADFVGTGEKPKGVMGWTNEGDNDLHEFPAGKNKFKDIPFDIIDPAMNGRRAVLALSADEGYKREAVIPVNERAGSLYFLHCIGAGSIAGSVTFRYADGAEVTKYITTFGQKGQPQSIVNWWSPDVPEGKSAIQQLHTAWIGKNSHTPKLGVAIYGMNNPHPEKEIESLFFEGQKDNTKWMILGLTLSDAAVYFTPNILSSIPAHWAAAECIFGFIEGLVGVQDAGVAFNKARLTPRWEAAGKDEVSATVKYEASGGYLSYSYNRSGSQVQLEFTGNALETEIEMLIPKGEVVTGLKLDGEPSEYEIKDIEDSSYILLKVEGSKLHRVELSL